jgi:hypothetical protein
MSGQVRGRACALPLLAGLALATAVSAPARAGGAGIFSDGFESGDVSAWSSATGLPEPVTAYRISDLDLRDPHTFVEAVLCFDVTDDSPLPFSFNGSLETLITTDDDGDGFLDLSVLLLFRPLDLAAQDERVDLAGAICTAPAAGTVCSQDPLNDPAITTYDSLGAGVCLAPEPGTTSGYDPAVPEPAAPCFVGQPVTVIVDLGGVAVPLEQAQVAATWSGGDPPTAVAGGLLRGFLSEAVADALLLPAKLPIVGGQPLSVLLPGGTGNCAAGDDRDVLGKDTGWWFYLEFTADQVEYVGL